MGEKQGGGCSRFRGAVAYNREFQGSPLVRRESQV